MQICQQYMREPLLVGEFNPSNMNSLLEYPVQGAGWSRRKAKGMGLFHLGRPKTEGFWDTQSVFLAQLLAIDMQTISANPSNDYWFLVVCMEMSNKLVVEMQKRQNEICSANPPTKWSILRCVSGTAAVSAHWRVKTQRGARKTGCSDRSDVGNNVDRNELTWLIMGAWVWPKHGVPMGQIGQPS